MALSLITLSFRTDYNESGNNNNNGNTNEQDPPPDQDGEIDPMAKILVDSYTTGTAGNQVLLNNSSFQIAIAQSFTGAAVWLGEATFDVQKSGSPSGNLVAKLYAHSGTFGTSSVPTGSPLATSDNIAASSITTSYQTITFPFSGANRIQLTAGTKYVIVIDSAGTTSDISNFFTVRAVSSGASHAGNYAGFSTSWAASSTIDTRFRVYGYNTPLVDTNAGSSIGSTRATFNADIDAVGAGNATARGFVYGFSTLSDPGDVAPASSGYANFFSESGSFSTGAFDEVIAGLLSQATYYVRAYAENSAGFSYGDEVTITTLQLTTVPFSGVDPTDIFKTVLDNYGGAIAYDGSSTDDTGLSLSYTFITATVLEGVKKAFDLAPAGWYWYVDLGTNVAYFKNTASTATHTLIKGNHLSEINIVLSTQEVKNVVYFTGGDSGGGSNLFEVYVDQDSIDDFGQQVERVSDNRVTLTATADAIADGILDSQKDEKNYTVVEVLDETYDITLFKPGDTVGFAGFGSFVDNLILQIVRIDYTPDKVKLSLGELPTRLSSTVEQVRRDLLALQTVNNPSTPS